MERDAFKTHLSEKDSPPSPFKADLTNQSPVKLASQDSTNPTNLRPYTIMGDGTIEFGTIKSNPLDHWNTTATTAG